MSQSSQEEKDVPKVEPPYFDVTKDLSKFKSKIEEAETDLKCPGNSLKLLIYSYFSCFNDFKRSIIIYGGYFST